MKTPKTDSWKKVQNPKHNVTSLLKPYFQTRRCFGRGVSNNPSVSSRVCLPQAQGPHGLCLPQQPTSDCTSGSPIIACNHQRRRLMEPEMHSVLSPFSFLFLFWKTYNTKQTPNTPPASKSLKISQSNLLWVYFAQHPEPNKVLGHILKGTENTGAAFPRNPFKNQAYKEKTLGLYFNINIKKQTYKQKARGLYFNVTVEKNKLVFHPSLPCKLVYGLLTAALLTSH